MSTKRSYVVKYKLRDDNDASCCADDGPFATYREAMDHRNWFFGHSPGVVSCWIANDLGDEPRGAVLKRD